MISPQSLIKKVKGIDIFALGPSAFLYYFLIFFLAPFLVAVGISFGMKMTDYGGINLQSLLYLVIGFITLLLGYYFFSKKRFVYKTPQVFKSNWRPCRVSWVFGITFVLGFIAKAIRILTGGYFFSEQASAGWKYVSFYSALSIFDKFSLIALVIAFIWYYHLKKGGEEHYKVWRNVAWGTLTFIILYFLPMCSKLHIIIPIVLVLIVRWYVLKKSYKSLVFVFLGLILLLFPFSNICRTPNTLIAHSVVQKITIDEGPKCDDEKFKYNIDADRALDFVSDSFLNRMSQYKVFTRILEHPQPLLYGKPFLKFFVSLGPPRFLWKNKPIITPDGNAFGHRIELLSPNDHATAVGRTVVGDWYLNFGLFGIIFGMFLMGMIFRIIYNYLITKPEISLSGIMVYSFIWINLISGMERSIAPVYAGIVKFVFILVMIHLFLTYSKNDFKNIINKCSRSASIFKLKLK